MSRRFSNDWKNRFRKFQSLELFAAVALVSAGTALAAEVVEIPPRTHTVVMAEAPRDLPLRSFGFREAGLRAGLLFAGADEIRIMGSTNALQSAPLARIWINAQVTNSYWFYTGGQGSAEDFVVAKGRTVVAVTRASTNAIRVTLPGN